MTNPDITPPDVGDDAQDPKPDAVSFEIEHQRDFPDDVTAWVPVATITVGEWDTGYMALRTLAERNPGLVKPGRYRVIDRRYGASFDEYDVRLVQHVAIDRVKDDSDSQVSA